MIINEQSLPGHETTCKPLKTMHKNGSNYQTVHVKLVELNLWIKVDGLNFNHIYFVWFKIECDNVEKQNHKNRVTVQNYIHV